MYASQQERSSTQRQDADSSYAWPQGTGSLSFDRQHDILGVKPVVFSHFVINHHGLS